MSFLRWIVPAKVGGYRNQESRQVRLDTGGRYSERRRGRKARAAASLVGSDGSASSRLIAGTGAHFFLATMRITYTDIATGFPVGHD